MSGSANLRLTDRDLRMLAFMGEHHLVLERQLEVLAGIGRDPLRRRLGRLAGEGYVERVSALGRFRCCRIGDGGLAALAAPLGPPKDDPARYRHEIGAAWLWLAAWRGAFGPVAEVIGERRLSSHDMKAPDEPYSVRLGGYDAHGHPRRHRPDLLLIDAHGRRLALELELSFKGKAALEPILAGYGADRRLDGVVYLVEASRSGRWIGRAVHNAAAEIGLSDRVSVRTVSPIMPEPAGAGDRHSARRAERAVAEAVL